MGIFNHPKKTNPNEVNNPQYRYTEDELDEYEEHIQKCYGPYKDVFHELVSTDIHLDVIIVPPAENSPYYKLITMGAGAYRMNVPEKLKDYALEYAEYVIYLPAEWDISSAISTYYWPIGLLKNVARIPIQSNTWLGYGHTIHGNSDSTPFDDSTSLNSLVLLTGLDVNGESCDLQLSSGKKINLYQIVPLYQEELDFKLTNGLNNLLDKFPDSEFPPIVKAQRKNYCL